MNQSIQVFEIAPDDFNTSQIVAGCYCLCKAKILLLQRVNSVRQGNKWSLPAGKLEKGETPLTTAVRELTEETGIIVSPEELTHLGTLFNRIGSYDYIFEIFFKEFPDYPKVNLKLDEHHGFCWATHEESLKLPLIHGGKEVMQYCLRRRQT